MTDQNRQRVRRRSQRWLKKRQEIRQERWLRRLDLWGFWAALVAGGLAILVLTR